MSDSEAVTPREDLNVCPAARGVGRLWGVVVAVLVLAGAGLVLLSTARYGAGISPESTAYLDVARNLAAGKGLVFHTREPMVWYPPLYPMLLALIALATRLDPSAFAHVVNALLLALVVYLSARLIQTGSRRPFAYGLLGVCAVLFSKPLSGVYAMTYSECLFIPLVLLYLISAERYWHGGSVQSLAFMILSTAFACLTRYIGVALVLAGVVTIILAPKVGVKNRLGRALAFAALTLIPLGLWAARNYRLTETLFGNRGPIGQAMAGNAIAGVRTLLSWYVPGCGTKFMLLAGAAVVLAALVVSGTARRRALSGLKAVLADHSAAVLLLTAYFMTLSMAGTRDAAIDSRALSPVYVPATLILLRFAYDLLSPSRPVSSAFAKSVPSILLALWLLFPLRSVTVNAAGRFRNGAGGYSTKKWRESETVARARQLSSVIGGDRVYSNGPEVLWELARVDAARTPQRAVGSLSHLECLWRGEKGIVLVWFEDTTWRRYLLSVEELREIADIAEVARLSDGSIYRVSTRQTAPSDTGQRGNVLPNRRPLDGRSGGETAGARVRR